MRRLLLRIATGLLYSLIREYRAEILALGLGHYEMDRYGNSFFPISETVAIVPGSEPGL